jgi:hypothetical protein
MRTENPNLPTASAYDHPEDGRLIFVVQGREGFWEKDAVGVVDDTLKADKWNAAHDINKAEAEAMFAGCMLGWDYPSADPANYDEKGSFTWLRFD